MRQCSLRSQPIASIALSEEISNNWRKTAKFKSRIRCDELSKLSIVWSYALSMRLGATKPRFRSHLHIASDLGVGFPMEKDAKYWQVLEFQHIGRTFTIMLCQFENAWLCVLHLVLWDWQMLLVILVSSCNSRTRWIPTVVIRCFGVGAFNKSTSAPLSSFWALSEPFACSHPAFLPPVVAAFRTQRVNFWNWFSQQYPNDQMIWSI